MGYYIDLTGISLDQYKAILKSADLLPSRRILQENINENFEVLKRKNIQNVDGLLKVFNSKKKMQLFAAQENFDENYLAVLVREAKSYKPRPNNIKDFPGITEAVVSGLETVGIKNTLHLFDKIKSKEGRAALSAQTSIDEAEMLRLAKLTDLSRIRWVNHTFAYVLLEAGFDTAEKVAHANYEDLYNKIKQLNSERNLYKGNIGLHDMKLCVEAAKDVPAEIAF